MMATRLLLAVLSLLILIVLAAGVWRYDYPPEVLMFPAIAGVGTVLLCAWSMACLPTGRDTEPGSPRFRGAWREVVWMGLAVPVLFAFGVVGGSAIYAMATLARRGVAMARALSIGLLVAASMYLAFEYFLGINLPTAWITLAISL